jgi:hypothetical protein
VAGKDLIRFTFCKKDTTLAAAAERLIKLQLQPAGAKQNPG